ncbi:MAG: ABC transporter substrate-binding protein [Rhizobiales bacterium]|nr:ABC transporter substrate-binding protein [Hyphomicrobiales bacterium]
MSEVNTRRIPATRTAATLWKVVARTAATLALVGQAGIAAAQAPAPIKIGILNDQSGVYSSITGPGSVAAARLAIEDVGGSVLGRPVEIVVADHQHKPDLGSTIAREWFDVQGVDAIFDIYSSGVSLAVQKIAQDKNKLLVVSMASSGLISGQQCSANGMQWANDGFVVSNLTVRGPAGSAPTSWFFITVDYTAGHSIEADASRMIKAAGGTVAGAVRFPIGSPDFSSFLLRAQSSGAKNIGFIGGGTDMINAMKQADEFGIRAAGQRFVPFSMTTVDISAVGSQVAAGMPLVLSFYWGENEATQRWADRFKRVTGRLPTDPQANVYSAVLHYLKSVQAAGTRDTTAVLARMRATPVEDFFTHGARIRADGRLMRDVFYAEAKAPGQMRNADDLLTLVSRVPGEQAFTPAQQSECPLMRQ